MAISIAIIQIISSFYDVTTVSISFYGANLISCSANIIIFIIVAIDTIKKIKQSP